MASHTRWSIHVAMKRLLAVAAATLVVGCSMEKQTPPSLTGPSELGLSIGVTATPDVITQDGQSQATIDVFARDANGQPMTDPVSFRAEIYAGGTPVDFGTLSTKVSSTGSDGHARLTYRAPAAPPPTADSDALVQILITPVGTNYAGVYPRDVQIRLARPGVIIPPGDGPQASFAFSPTAPHELDDVFFDASGSTSANGISSYAWNFGDGSSDSSSSASTRHSYDLAGSYNVTLAVTDTLGRRSTTSKTVTVTAAAGLKADFTFSPTTPKAGDVVFFNASPSTAAANHRIVEYRWDFGDNSVTYATSSPQIVHQYAGSGSETVTYVAVLVITDDAGKTSTVTHPVAVAKP